MFIPVILDLGFFGVKQKLTLKQELLHSNSTHFSQYFCQIKLLEQLKPTALVWELAINSDLIRRKSIELLKLIVPF